MLNPKFLNETEFTFKTLPSSALFPTHNLLTEFLYSLFVSAVMQAHYFFVLTSDLSIWVNSERWFDYSKWWVGKSPILHASLLLHQTWMLIICFVCKSLAVRRAEIQEIYKKKQLGNQSINSCSLPVYKCLEEEEENSPLRSHGQTATVRPAPQRFGITSAWPWTGLSRTHTHEHVT